MKKTLKINEAVFHTMKGNQIPLEKIKEGFVVNVGGKTEKGNFMVFKAIFEKGEFFLQYGQKVEILPKTVISK